MDLHRYPYASHRTPVLASNGVVATSQPFAAQAGLEMLLGGGNAVDAAIAAAAALTVVEPSSTGIGGDAFAIVWDGRRLHGINGSGRWPARMDLERLRAEGHTQVPERGWASVTVPEAPAVWQDLHLRFGRLELPEIFAPAIRYAEEGFPVSPLVSRLWAQAAPTLPQHADVPVAGLFDPAYLESRRRRIGELAGEPGPGEPPKGGTVYLCTADRDGMMASFIQSNYSGFGSGVVMPELGVALQSRAACFRLEPDHPNTAAPGKRPRHTIIPAFLTRGGEPVGPFGVMGAEMQPQGHVQVVCGMVDHGLNPQAALDAPRPGSRRAGRGPASTLR